jgi:transcriptional regulator with XRE-family HTH domain
MTPLRIEIRSLREAKGLSQAQLAKDAGVGIATVKRLEAKNPPRGIDLDTLEGLARALGVAPGALIGHRFGTLEELQQALTAAGYDEIPQSLRLRAAAELERRRRLKSGEPKKPRRRG